MDFQCDTVKVSGKDALATYQRLKATADIIPVILGDDDDLTSMAEAADYITESFSQLLQQAENIDAADWVDKREA